MYLKTFVRLRQLKLAASLENREGDPISAAVLHNGIKRVYDFLSHLAKGVDYVALRGHF